MSRMLRLASLELMNFKGVRSIGGAPVRIEFGDADIILLIGANGRGKTTVIEALELIGTGAITRRVGDKGEFSIGHFINRHTRATGGRDAVASVTVNWTGGGNDTATIRNQRNASPECVGVWREQRNVDWNTDGRLNQLRTTTFLYSDALGAMLGLDLEARRNIIDSYLPPLERLLELPSLAEDLRARSVEARNRLRKGLPDLMDFKVRRNRAIEMVHGTLRELGDDFKDIDLLTKQGAPLANIQPKWTKLGKVLKCLTSAPPRPSDLAAAARRMSLEEADRDGNDAHASLSPINPDSALAASPAKEDLFAALGGEKRNALSLESEMLEPLNREIADCEELLRKNQLDLNVVYHAAAPWRIGGELKPVTLGTIPLLATLAHCRAASLPNWWNDAGLPVTDFDRFSGLLKIEMERAEALGAAEKRNRTRLDELLHRREGLARAQQFRGSIAAPESAGQSGIEGFPRPTTASRNFGPTEHRLSDWSPAPVKLRRSRSVLLEQLADSLANVARSEDALADAEQRHKAAGIVSKNAELLDKFEGLLAKLVDKTFEQRLRAMAVKAQYGQNLNEAMRRILSAYAHRQELLDAARVEFNAAGQFKVVVGDETDSTGISSLSRSQLTSIAFALAISANLGLPEPPLGFMCLDDVSDAFDLDNLAADASIIRTLAYGERDLAGEKTPFARRQLILTNHNDELTNRLVPLLLPPKGRSMRVVQLTGANDEVVEVHQWNMQGESTTNDDGRSPLRLFYPERAAPAAPSDKKSRADA